MTRTGLILCQRLRHDELAYFCFNLVTKIFAVCLYSRSIFKTTQALRKNSELPLTLESVKRICGFCVLPVTVNKNLIKKKKQFLLSNKEKLADMDERIMIMYGMLVGANLL